MPKIYKIKVYLTEFVKGQSVSSVPVDDVSTFKDLHRFLLEQGMKVNINLGPFRNNLVEHFQMLWEQAYIDDIPEDKIGKYSFFPKDVKQRYPTCHGYSVEVLNPVPLPANDE